MANYCDDIKNNKFQPGKFYCWENSDYTIEVLKVNNEKASVKGWKVTREPIHTDENGNEYFKLGWQTFYAFCKC